MLADPRMRRRTDYSPVALVWGRENEVKERVM